MIAFYTKFKTRAEDRTKLASILARASQAMQKIEACTLYNVALSYTDDSMIEVTEFWTDEEAHAASLGTEEAKSLIAEAMPLLVDKPSQIKLGQVITTSQ